MPALRPLTLCLLFVLMWSSGCGVSQDYPREHVTPWPLVELSGEGHQRPRALVIRRILNDSDGGRRLDVLHEEIVDSGLFSSVQTRATESQSRPGYDYILRFSLSSRDNYEWVAWLGLIPGFPIFSEEIYTLTCTVFDGEQERLGEIERQATMQQAFGLLILPFNVIYTILPGSSSYDLLGISERESLMIRAMTRDALMLANEEFDFRPPTLLTAEEKQEAKRREAEKHHAKGLTHLNSQELVEAEEAFAQAIKADPTYKTAWYNLACTYARMKRLDAAEEALSYAIKAGYRDAAHMNADKDLDLLRERASYLRLLEGLTKERSGTQKESGGADPEAPKGEGSSE